MTTADSQTNPLMQMLQMMNGLWLTQCIGVAAQLGIADHLVEGAQPVEALAESVNADAQSLYRLLRALASSGIFSETQSRHFQLTPMAECLRSDSPHSIRGLAIWTAIEPAHWGAWGNLLKLPQEWRDLPTPTGAASEYWTIFGLAAA